MWGKYYYCFYFMVDQIRLKEVKILARGHTVTMRSAWMASREPGSRVQIRSLRLSKTNLLFLLKQSGAITYPKPFSPLGAQLELKPRSISHLKKLLPKEGKLQKEMATHSSVLAWRIPGTGEPCGLPSVGSHRVGHDWSDLAAKKENRKHTYGHQGSKEGG